MGGTVLVAHAADLFAVCGLVFACWVLCAGSFDPKGLTIMIAVNLQTAFPTPPLGFAPVRLRGVAPAAGHHRAHSCRGAALPGCCAWT